MLLKFKLLKLFKRFITLLGILQSILVYSQGSNLPLVMSPNPFDSILQYDITVKENDTINLEVFNGTGKNTFEIQNLICTETSSKLFTLDSVKTGVHIGRFELNETMEVHKWIYNGTANSPKFRLNVKVIKNNESTLISYPNPVTTEFLTLGIESTSNEIEYQIFSIEGKLIVRQKVTNPYGTMQHKINTTGWETGQYIVKLKAGNEKLEQTILKLAQ
jgi:hypothetical protein